MIKILIADDHPLIREGLKRLLSEQKDMKVTGEAVDARETLDRIRASSYDVVLLDLRMPGRWGLDVLEQIRRERPDLPVLIVSGYPEESFAVHALKLGAAGYLAKESKLENLVEAVRKVVQGGKYVTPSLAEKLALDLERGWERPHERLSQRELQVLSMLGDGMSVSQIARELALSVKTVSTHRSRILVKMNLKTTSELVRYAIENDLAGPGREMK